MPWKFDDLNFILPGSSSHNEYVVQILKSIWLDMINMLIELLNQYIIELCCTVNNHFLDFFQFLIMSEPMAPLPAPSTPNMQIS